MSASTSMLRRTAAPLFPLTAVAAAVLVSTGVLVCQNHVYHRRSMDAIDRLRREKTTALHLPGVVPAAPAASIESDFPFITKVIESMDDDERKFVSTTARIVDVFQRDPEKFWESARKTLLEKIAEEEEARGSKKRGEEPSSASSSGSRRKTVPITVVGEETP